MSESPLQAGSYSAEFRRRAPQGLIVSAPAADVVDLQPIVYSSVIMMTARTWIPLTVLGTALAQGPMPPQPQQSPDFSALKSYLNLTDAQIRQMQQAREKAAREAEEKTKTLRPQIEEKHRALADLLDRDNADATT